MASQPCLFLPARGERGYVAYCEEKMRLILAYNVAVNHYCNLVQQRHDGFDSLDGDDTTLLMAKIRAASQETTRLRAVADAHICSHGCDAMIQREIGRITGQA
jgi:hypothetical protein